jgi:16S rRNA (guanine1207-N2)-methyltransferase
MRAAFYFRQGFQRPTAKYLRRLSMPHADDEFRPAGQQYFAAQPAAESAPAQVRWRLPERIVNLWTDRGVFSRGKVDRGTDLLARTMRLPAEGEILDLGAGYGPLGLVAALRHPEARVTLVELNERAADLARRNLELNGVTNAEVLVGDAPEVLGERTFDAVVTNPPFRVGKVAMMRLLADAAARLRPGGSLWLVAQTKQGAKTLARDLGAFLPHIETVEISGGYRIIRGHL